MAYVWCGFEALPCSVSFSGHTGYRIFPVIYLKMKKCKVLSAQCQSSLTLLISEYLLLVYTEPVESVFHAF